MVMVVVVVGAVGGGVNILVCQKGRPRIRL